MNRCQLKDLDTLFVLRKIKKDSLLRSEDFVMTIWGSERTCLVSHPFRPVPHWYFDTAQKQLW